MGSFENRKKYNKQNKYLFLLILFIKFPALFAKGTQVRINMYFFILFTYFILKASAKKNKINRINIYSELSSFPKKELGI